jgi:outer membrane protein
LFTQSYKQVTGYEVLGTQVLYYDLNNNPVYAPFVRPTGTEVTPFNSQISNNLSKFVGLNLSIPIFNGYQVRSNIRTAKNNYEIAQINYEGAENKLYQDIFKAVADYNGSLSNLYAARKSRDASAKSYEFAKLREEAGLLNFIEFAQIKSNFAKAEIQAKQAEYQYLFRLKVIEFYKEGSIKF